VRVGEQATVADYVAPPRMLSGEVNAGKEATWSIGEYVAGTEIWSALSLPGQPPERRGIFADQPSPFGGSVGRLWPPAVMLFARAGIFWIAHLGPAREKGAFAQVFLYAPRRIQEASFVTPMFELDGRPSAVRVETATTLENQWMDVDYALVNDE